ncbi:unnamed protein product [Urochloa humidicola]
MGGSDAEEAAPSGRERPPADKVAVGIVPLHRLFSFADRADAALMALGTVAAVANGMARPLMIFILGDVIDAFGSTDSSSNVVHRVSKVHTACFFLLFILLETTAEHNLESAGYTPHLPLQAKA